MKYQKRIFITMLLFLALCLISQNRLDVKIIPDVVYHNGTDYSLTLDVYQPFNQNGAAILFINSGGFHSPWAYKQYEQLESGCVFIQQEEFNSPDFIEQFSFEQLLTNGYTVFDVRHQNGPISTLNKIVEDCEAALDFIIDSSKNYDIDKNKIGLWGASAGAALAAYLGFKENSKVNSIVLYYPGGYDYLKFPELIKSLPALQIDKELLKTLNVKKVISAEAPPTLILYGELDSDFITDPSEKIYKDLDSLGVESQIIEFPNIGHIWRDKSQNFNEAISNKAMEELIEWFNKNTSTVSR